jgi:hypothetical protein
MPSQEVDMKMKDFAQYLNNVSFDEALHQARQLSYERVVANEQPVDAVRPSTPRPQRTSKVAVA